MRSLEIKFYFKKFQSFERRPHWQEADDSDVPDPERLRVVCAEKEITLLAGRHGYSLSLLQVISKSILHFYLLTSHT